MTETRGPTNVTAFFARASEAGVAAVTAYEAERAPDARFQRYLLLALAALDGCARQAEPEPADVQFLRVAAADAAGVCRTAPPTDGLVDLARGLDEVSDVCARLADGKPWQEAQPSGWSRFLFDDVDFEVRRAGGEWRLRQSVAESRSRVFDHALERLEPSLSNFRIAEITVQVLDWYAHLDERV